MNDEKRTQRTAVSGHRIDLVWGREGGLGGKWAPEVAAGLVLGALPSPQEVEALYAAAAAEPPLNEAREFAELFADVYETSVRKGQMLASFIRQGRRLIAFAYGHYWTWEEQDYSWAHELEERLGDAAALLDHTYSLNLLARDPRARGVGLGRSTLEAWLEEIGGFPCWLQTDDLDSPARGLYESLGFSAIGHGPDAPNGRPGLVMLRPVPHRTGVSGTDAFRG